MNELDLHGHTVDEALRAFVAYYNRRLRAGCRDSIRVIHGYGSLGTGGKIQRRLRKYLANREEHLTWTPGEDCEDNPGATIVHLRTLLPEPGTMLAADILAYCSIARTESKIAGQFRQYPAREIKEAIRSLVRSGLMAAVAKKDHEAYIDCTTDQTP